MYKCDDCDSTFDSPVVVREEYECYGRPSFDVVSCCPFCFGWAVVEISPDTIEFVFEEDL